MIESQIKFFINLKNLKQPKFALKSKIVTNLTSENHNNDKFGRINQNIVIKTKIVTLKQPKFALESKMLTF